MQGRVGWTFPEREPGLALAPGALITPHPSLLQRAAKTSSGQDYVYWVDHREASGTDPGKQRGSEGGGEGTSIEEETGCVHHPFPFLPALRARQRADEWVEHRASSIREVMDSVAGPTRGRGRGVPFTSSPAPRTQLCPFDLLLKFPSPGVWVGGQDLALPPLCPLHAPSWPSLARNPWILLMVPFRSSRDCFSWKAELRWDEGCG